MLADTENGKWTGMVNINLCFIRDLGLNETVLIDGTDSVEENVSDSQEK